MLLHLKCQDYMEFLEKWDGKMPTYYGGDADLLLSLNPDKEKAAE